jgi:hypothetical protein
MKKDAHNGVEAAAAISIGDALRAVGFGEHALATEMQALAGRLTKKNTNPRVLLDVLKECGRHLSAQRARDGECSEDEAVQVELVHNVARPAREKRDAKTSEREKQIGFQFEKETP